MSPKTYLPQALALNPFEGGGIISTPSDNFYHPLLNQKPDDHETGRIHILLIVTMEKGSLAYIIQQHI